MTIKERVMQILEYKGIAKENFFTQIGMTSANFRGNARFTPLNSNAIANIFAIIPDLNLVWLITGQGSMLKSAAPVADNKFAMELIEKKDETIKKLERTIWEQEKQIEELKKVSAISTSTLPGTTYTSPQQRK